MNIFTEELRKFIESKLSKSEEINWYYNNFRYTKKETSKVLKIKSKEVENKIFNILKEYGYTQEVLENIKITEVSLFAPVKRNEEESERLLKECELTSVFDIIKENV